jgi:hypothetical protein
MARRVNMHLDEEFAAQIEAQKPKSLALAAFCALLIEQALDPLTGGSRLPAYCVGAGTSSNLQTKAQPANEADSDESTSTGLPEFEKSFLPGDVLGDGVGRGLSGGPPRKPPFKFSVPADLDWCRDKLETFWREGKSGKKSKHAAALLFSGLRSIAEKYGEKVVLEQLELATAKGFDNITLKNYEQFGVARRNTAATPAQPEHKHPAAREFRNGRFVDEDGPTTNPALEGLF